MRIFQASLAVLIASAGMSSVEATCDGTLSFTVLGQPNIAVGFLDTNALGDDVVLGTVTKKTDNSESNVTLRCVSDSLVVTFGPTEDTENLGGGWTFDARSTNGTRAGSDFTWQTKVHLLDILYDTRFDAIDVLQGQFRVRVNNSYLINKYGWVSGTSTMVETVYGQNERIKRQTGSCPVLAKSIADGGSDLETHHRHKDDFVDYGGLAHHGDYIKRMSFMKEFVAEQMNGVLHRDVQVEEVFAAQDSRSMPLLMDAFRKDQYTDFTAMETSLVDHLPGNQNAYGWDNIRFRMQCMTPFYTDFDPVEYFTFAQTETFRRFGKHQDVIYHTTHDLSNFGRKKLELKWIMHPTLNSVWEDDQFVNRSNINQAGHQSGPQNRHGTQYPKPEIPLQPNQATFSMQGMATLAFSEFFEWWTGRAPPDNLVNLFKPFWIRSLNYPEMRSRYGRYDAVNFYSETLRLDFLHFVVDSPLFQHLDNYTHQTGWHERDSHEDIFSTIVTRVMPALVSFCAKNAYDIINKFREDTSYRIMYKENKVKFIHEWVRLHGGENKIKVYDQSPERRNEGKAPWPGPEHNLARPRNFNVTYYKRTDYCGEHRYPDQTRIPCLTKNIPASRRSEDAEFPGSIPEDFPDSDLLTTAELTHTGRLMDYVDLYSGNRDPARFVGPNTFNMNRTDWMHNVAWGSPLWAYYKSASNTNPDCGPNNQAACVDTDPEVLAVDANGEYILDMDKALRIRKRWCPAYFHSRVIIQDLVDLYLEKIEFEEAQRAAATPDVLPTCTNRQTEAQERFGTPWFNQNPTADICTWAMARIDVRLGRGAGCAKHGSETGICCATCAQPGFLNSQVYTNVMRMTALKNVREDVFTQLTPAIWDYFLLTQKYFDDSSALSVTIVGVDRPYVGAKNILEYYTLQVAGFSPRSHRHFGVRYENNTDAFVPVNGNQMQLLNMNPQVNNGVEQADTDALWSDFAHFIWDNDSAVTPIRKAFVDFRYPNVFPIDTIRTITPERVGANLPLLNSFGNVWDLCQLLHTRCYNKNRQFESVDKCMDYMKKLPDHKLGYCPIFAGNTKACRFMHSILAQDILDPDYHCFHMGPHNPDPDGNIKCHDDDCGHERQGKLDCDENGCEGSLMHSGDVVEWMFTFYHLLALAYTLAMLVGVKVMLKRDDLTDSHRTLVRQGEAILVTLVGVFTIHTLIHVISQAGRPDILWRAPPMESLEQRMCEIGDPQNRFREYMHVEDEYEGQYTEKVFGCSNGFIADHLVYFLMFTGFEIMCVTTEWVGYEYHFHCESHNKLARYLPLIGHSVFVVFVSLAYMLPPSAMSGIVFLAGVTQLGYPEVIMQSFNAAGLVIEDLYHDEEEKSNEDGEEGKSYEETPEKRPARHSVFNLRSNPADTLSVRRRKSSMAQTHLRRRMSRYNPMNDNDNDNDNDNEADTRRPRSSRVVRHRDDAHNHSKMGLFEQVVRRMNAVGVCLHHMAMISVYLGYALNILYTPQRMLFTGVRILNFLVLVQHVILQLLGASMAGMPFLVITEYFFQHFCISFMGECGSNLLSSSVFKLVLSHWLMIPVLVHGFVKGLMARHHDDNDDDDDADNEFEESDYLARKTMVGFAMPTVHEAGKEIPQEIAAQRAEIEGLRRESAI